MPYLIQETLVVLSSHRNGDRVFRKYHKVCEANKFRLEEALKASKNKLSEARKRVVQLKLVRTTLKIL